MYYEKLNNNNIIAATAQPYITLPFIGETAYLFDFA